MKKCIGMILVAAMLMLAGAAFAEGPGGNMGGIPPMQGGPQQENQPQMNGPAPSDQQGNQPQMNGQAPNGQQPGNAPQMNGQAPNGQMPINPPQMDGNGPEMKMIDFDAMAENSVISAETLAKIKAYMEENKPAEMNAQQPMNGMPPEKPETDGEKTDADPEGKNGLLEDLLSAGIITQEEYEALNAEQ